MIDTVCIFLGPLNNLTTLTATALAFHPNVQVLNHGARILWEAKGCNFLADFTEESFGYFVDEAIDLSLTAGISYYPGGSIFAAHSFEESQELIGHYVLRYGPSPLKEDVRCLVWKDPMEVERYLDKNMIDFHDLFAADGGRLKFILPIRNPLDTMISMSRGEHWKLYDGLTNSQNSGVLNRILACMVRFFHVEQHFPGRFFHFVQDEFADPSNLLDLSSFLCLEPDEEWMKMCETMWQVRPSYQVDPVSRAVYRLIAQVTFSQFPADMEKLARFADVEGTRPQ